MHRRQFLVGSAGLLLGSSLGAAMQSGRFDKAADVLQIATESGQVSAAVIHVMTGHDAPTWTQAFGRQIAPDSMFLLGSVSKPIAVAALMTLDFGLDDRLQKYIPAFKGEGRERVTMRHLLTHTSGLPDQLPENDLLRKQHAQLPEFVAHAIRTPLLFAAGEKYSYSSLGILLAAHVAERLSGVEIRQFIEQTVFKPLQMERSAQGLGRFQLQDFVPCQTEHAAPESGAGDPAAKDWDWNSPYWRSLGAPWGGAHASAPDVGKFLADFLFQRGRLHPPETSHWMTVNHNPAGLPPRGLGFNVGNAAGSAGCSDRTFGHTGSTGTIAWADPAIDALCVVLTSLPGRAVTPHPRTLAADLVAAAWKGE